jgi:N,N'-diacetylchitobiose phosphorylase
MLMPDSIDSAESLPIVASNGTYACFLTPAGTGFSSYRDCQLTNWRDDPCEDDLGFYIYLRDLRTSSLTTACGAVLAGQEPGSWHPDATGAALHRTHDDVESIVRLEVLADRPIERRIVRLTNVGHELREFELTGYVEVVLNQPDAHSGHPAFSKLFVETEWHAGRGILLASRRPRSNNERHPTMALALDGASALEWETDRSRFLGRGRRPTRPRALTGDAPLSGRVGAVLDPVLALRTRVRLAPGEATEVRFILGAADDGRLLSAHISAATASAPAAPARPVSARGEPLAPPAIAKLVEGYVAAARREPRTMPAVAPAMPSAPGVAHPRRSAPRLRAANGFGGFSADGREYVIQLGREPDGTLRLPPMPWSNVLANEHFGLIVSEKGAMSTWSRNSRLHRLTPWRNDAIVDPHDEALYVRDEENGAFWSALPGPAPAAHVYEVRHGFGYSRWRHHSAGLAHEVTLYVAQADPVRVADVRITNDGPATRRLSFYAFNRWVLGVSSAATRDSLRVEFDAARGAVLARNPAAPVSANGIAFAALAGVEPGEVDACTDRAAFLGIPGFAEAPRALTDGGRLPGASGSQPAAVLRVELTVPPGRHVRLQALLGEAGSIAELEQLLAAYRVPDAATTSFRAVSDGWLERLGRTEIHTPVPAIDLMVNGWLVYQTVACRLWARTAFYQSGGAFGFRDQLQDAAALAHNQPELLRRQLLANAAHQFIEGDVLHWWHPPHGDGIRTRFADDLVWLPYLTARYVSVTGDAAVLAESVGFKRAPLLDPGEDERKVVPSDAGETADLYTHCVRAFERAMTHGTHGLPLFGCGDWNDGMNRVGREGRGESVWMAFFLYAAIEAFLPLCRLRNDESTSARLTAYRAEMRTALEEAGWDGGWYRRGYYDNGRPLGSCLSDECQIDALVQAWAVISRAAPVERARQALDAVEQRLVSTDDGLIRLLAPPFVSTPEDPGYIKGYLAGVRENGGQYTHAALWIVKAMAEAGRRDRAAALLEMLSPVTRGGDRRHIAIYQVEPYVIAADVYGVAPHVGRGGWTWYTGSAGWMYRVALESVLGLELEGGSVFRLQPRIPDAWPGFELIHRRADGTIYHFAVENPGSRAERVVAASLDGNAFEPDADGARVRLASDGRRHTIRVVLGPAGGRT